jgi:hypothetical protein
VKHGAKVKRCSTEGCTNFVVKGGVCVKHGAKVKRCSSEGCTNQAQKGGVCTRHGAKIKRCSSDGCTNHARKGGVCIRHGAKDKLKRCSCKGCTNQSVRGGVCRRHGVYRNKNEESTAFGSEEFEEATVARSQLNQQASEPSITERGGQSIPGEVSIFCQEIVEV